jgi:ABC-type multidrug transport system ATPase subunit
MPSCRHCGTENAETYRFCQQCGRPLDAPDLTTPWAGTAKTSTPPSSSEFAQPGREVHRTFTVAELFAGKDRLTIGRAADCDVCLPHPSVSRTHALLERTAAGLILRDLGSVNGVLVRGRRIAEPVPLREHERVGIGPYLFCLAGGVIHALDSSRGVRLEARSLEKIVPLGRNQTKTLLAELSLVVEPGEFVALLGPSGSGKSTLMDCLNGRRPATRGQVLANGEDFYLHFDNFRQLLGYVPQRDIVHTQLTVYKALAYTARLRLPADTGPAELEGRIEEVLRLMELGPHRDTLVGSLSGGQIKRVSLGAELLARPALLYIDEATSGLDAGTEARMMRLFRHLAHEGKSVVCITHNVDNVDLCDQVVVLCAGRLVFYGPPAEGRAYFGTSRLSDVYDRLSEKPPAEWERAFRACSLHRQFVEGRLATAPPGSTMMVAPPAPAASPSAVRPRRRRRGRRQPLHQFWVLTARCAELLWRDTRTLRLLLLQGPVVALFILLGFAGQPFRQLIPVARPLTPEETAFLRDWHGRLARAGLPRASLKSTVDRLARDRPEAEQAHAFLARIPFKNTTVQDVVKAGGLLLKYPDAPVIPTGHILDPTSTYIMLCVVVLAVLWLGCSNGAREIAREDAIYARERSVNLGIVPYLASKFVVLTVVCAVQVLLVMAVIYGGLQLMHVWKGSDTPPPEYCMALLPQYGVLLLLAVTGVALGLLLSACVNNPERASTLLPYVLIPQIILCGGLLAVEEEPLRTLAYVGSPAYWGFRAVRLGATELPSIFPWAAKYNDNPWLACAALALQTVALLILTGWFLRRKDALKG